MERTCPQAGQGGLLAGQPWHGAPPKIPSVSLEACCSSRPHAGPSGLGIWWDVEADPGPGWPHCQYPLLFPKTGCVPATPGPSSPRGRGASSSSAPPCCRTHPSPLPCRGLRAAQGRVPRREFSGMITQAPQSQAGLAGRSPAPLGPRAGLVAPEGSEPQNLAAGGRDPAPFFPRGTWPHPQAVRAPGLEEFTPSPGSQDQATALLALSLTPQQWSLAAPRGLGPKQDSMSGGPGRCRVRLCGTWVSLHPQSAGQGGAEPRGAPARRMCSGQTGGGAQAGEAEIRASVRELRRCHAAGSGRTGLPAGWGGYAHPTPLCTTAPCSAPPQASPPLPRGQVGTHLSTQHLRGWGQGSWAGALGSSQKLGSLLGALRLGPSTCNSLHLAIFLSRGGRGACAAAGCPRCLGGMQGKPCSGKASVCPSVCAGVSGGSAVQSARRGWGGRVTLSRSGAALCPWARRGGAECRGVSDDVRLVPAAP